MTSAKWFGGILLTIAAGLAPQLAAQVQTDVPPAVAGAKPVTVELATYSMLNSGSRHVQQATVLGKWFSVLIANTIRSTVHALLRP